MTITSLLTALLLTAGAENAPAPPPPPPGPPPPAVAPARAEGAPVVPMKDPAALAILKKMSERLQKARTFSFRARTVLELPVTGGALATFVNNTSASVRRPDGVAGGRSGDLPDFRFAYDGKSLTVLAPAAGKWATMPMAPTLDGMVVDAAEKAGMNLPWDELLVADPYAAIIRDLVQAIRVTTASIDGRMVDHVLVTSPGLQLEYWIDSSTALLARANVVYTDDPLRPHFSAEFSDWKLNPKLPASAFELPRPKGAKQVDFSELAATYQ